MVGLCGKVVHAAEDYVGLSFQAGRIGELADVAKAEILISVLLNVGV